jgi:hypothetical protein
MFRATAHCRKMAGQQRANTLNSIQKGVGELPALEPKPHRFDNSAPEILWALCMNTDIAHDGKVVRSRADKNQDAIP